MPDNTNPETANTGAVAALESWRDTADDPEPADDLESTNPSARQAVHYIAAIVKSLENAEPGACWHCDLTRAISDAIAAADPNIVAETAAIRRRRRRRLRQLAELGG